MLWTGAEDVGGCHCSTLVQWWPGCQGLVQREPFHSISWGVCFFPAGPAGWVKELRLNSTHRSVVGTVIARRPFLLETVLLWLVAFCWLPEMHSDSHSNSNCRWIGETSLCPLYVYVHCERLSDYLGPNIPPRRLGAWHLARCWE